MGSVRAIPQALIDREQVRRRGLREFVCRAWPQIEPATLRWGWHLDAVCEHLEALARREIRDLVVLQPPGTSKSLLASVLWPAWVWTLDPTHRWLCASYSDKVVLRDARKCRTLVASDWFRARWPEVQVPRDATASAAVTDWYTTAGGMRYSQTIGGQWTGQHGDTLLVDDPLDPQGADLASGVEIDRVLRWWHETQPTRYRDQATRARVLVQQRIHERDLAAELIREGATVLCLPMRHEPTHPHRYPRDPRTTDGELLDPVRFPEYVVKELETVLGPRGTAAQLQQRPAPAGGSVFLAAWLRKYWVKFPAGGTFTLTCDAAFKDKAGSSLVSIQCWCNVGPDHFLVDRDTRHMSFTETCRALVSMTERWPRAHKKLLEAKANGPAIEDALKRDVPGIVMIEPEGGKVARANAVTGLFAGGNVILPHPTEAEYPDGTKGAPWVRGGAPLDRDAAAGSYEHVMASFPAGPQDDDVDATTQYLSHAAPSYASRLRAAMEKVYGR